MNPPRWSILRLKNRLMQRSPATPAPRLRVANITLQMDLDLEVEVADSGPKRSKGLLGRKGLPPGEGLWIIPCEAVHTFGMQFSIDLIYLDRKNRIKKLRSEVPPWRLSACLSAHSVLELAAGTLRNMQLKPGDTLEFRPASHPAHGATSVPERPEQAHKDSGNFTG
jgi:uncharacterized membrane protein (UPF0127 family)